MAKKILTKKDFNSLLKGKAVSVEYCGYSLGFELKDKSINMVDLSIDYVIYSVKAESGYDVCYPSFSGAFEGYICDIENIKLNKEIESDETLIDENGESDVEPEALLQVNTEYNTLDNITNEIVKSLSVAGVAQLNVALLIRLVYERKLYELGNYQNIYNYCADKFGIARGTVNNWLMVAKNFGVYDEASQRYILNSRLKGYSITQLVLLRSLSIDDIETYFETNMSCREIKGKVEGLNKHITAGAVEVKSPIENEESSDDAESEDIEASKKVSVTKKPNFIFELQGGMDFKQSKALEVILHALSTHKGKMFELKMTIKD